MSSALHPELHAESAEPSSDGPPSNGSLCEQCRLLTLGIDKFLPPTPATGHSSNDLTTGFDSTGLDPLELGYLDEIYKKRGSCAFCWLLFHASHSSEGSGVGLDGLSRDGSRVECRADWQLDGRLLDDESKPPTRRLRVFHPQQLFPDAYIVPFATPGAQSMVQPSFLGRRISESKVNVKLLHNWLETCKREHGPECERGALVSLKAEPLKNIRLIDVERECLVEYSSLERNDYYATISYTWGTKPFLKLKKKNIEELRKSIGPTTSDLPETLRDAMMLVKDLSVRYIWIDSLCIIQGCREDWAKTASQMARIYSQGIINICAAAGSGVHHGLPGANLTKRNTTQPVVSCHGMNFVVVRPIESLIHKTAWNARAWTFQERLLSRRSIIFTEDRVFFQCRGATWSEEVESESKSKIWNLDMMRSPLQNFRQNPVRIFMECVGLYSGRLLTFIFDRLVAFDGIGAVLCPPLRARLFYGLPDSYFDFALLWEKRTAGKSINNLQGKVILPSWSWCGWEGASTWRLSSVSGTLLNLHEWLTEHTWIVWYKAKGDVREPEKGFGIHTPQDASTTELIWTASGSEPEEMTTRWDGYRDSPTAPYGRKNPGHCHPEPATDLAERPTQPTGRAFRPGHLYFWTYTAHFRLSRKSMTTTPFATQLDAGLYRFGIIDAKGDWCGTIVLEDQWFNLVGGEFEFAAISEARDFSMEELDTWTYYIPADREVSEWYVFYALLLKWDEEKTVAERVGLAKIYKNAFNTASKKSWKEIILA